MCRVGSALPTAHGPQVPTRGWPAAAAHAHRYPQRHRLQLALELEQLVDGVAVAHQALGHHLDRLLQGHGGARRGGLGMRVQRSTPAGGCGRGLHVGEGRTRTSACPAACLSCSLLLAPCPCPCP